MTKKFDLIPDVKLLDNLESLFAPKCQFSVNFIREKMSQFGFVKPRTVRVQTLVERQINPACNCDLLVMVDFFPLSIIKRVDSSSITKKWQKILF